MSGHYVARAIHVAVKLGIADALASGPLSPEEVAESTGTHPPSVQRLLRALAGVGLFFETEQGAFGLTSLGIHLRADVPGSVRQRVLFAHERFHWQAWAYLDECVTTGRSAMSLAHDQDLWSYLAAHPQEEATFQAAMTQSSDRHVAPIVEAFDFSTARRIVDVGGGEGKLLLEILKEHPGAEGVLHDLPRVIERPAARQSFEAAGVARRCSWVAGDFKSGVPEGGDLYILKNIVHDWDDASTIQILKNCRRAMAVDGRVLIVQSVVPPGDDHHYSKCLDISMMVLCEGGRERTEAEYAALCHAAGLRLERVLATKSPMDILEATAPAPASPPG